MTDPLVAALELEVLPRLRAENRRRQSPEYAENARIYRALMLAPTIEIGEAILRGERVPLSRLNSDAARAYGLSP